MSHDENPSADSSPTSEPNKPSAGSLEDLNLELASSNQFPPGQFPPGTEPNDCPSGPDKTRPKRVTTDKHPPALHLATSTFLSLVMVLGLLLLVRWMVPSMVENIRYSWHRGQLRAQYDHSSGQLSRVSLSSIEAASEHVSSRVGPTVVHINLLRSSDNLSEASQAFARRDPSFLLNAQGSGFVIHEDGFILTNNHVVDSQAGSIEVAFSDGQKCLAEVVGRDPLTDVAVLKVDVDGLMVATWGDSDEAVVGTPVWAVGSPFGLQHTVSFGIISGKHRVDFSSAREVSGTPGSTAFGDMMQSDVVLHPGNSGGPLVNAKGEVVGMNAAILGEAFQGISFAIPSKIARRVAEEIIASGEVQRPWLGVRLLDLAADERFDKDGKPKRGVQVAGFPQYYSPARKSGLRTGDIIVEFDGDDVFGMASLQQLIASAKVGTEVEVIALRDGETKTFRVKLAKRAPNI